MEISNRASNIADAFSTAGDKLKNSMSFLGDLKETGADKINSFVNDILGLAPLIEVTGFNMKEVSVDMGIPPGINLSFVKEKDTDPKTIEQLLEDNKDKEILKLIVRGLQKADDTQKGLNLSNYKFRGLGMKVGLPPDISLKFERIEN